MFALLFTFFTNFPALSQSDCVVSGEFIPEVPARQAEFTGATIVLWKFVKNVNNLLIHIFCGYFLYKVPLVYRIFPRKLGKILINRGNFIPEVPLENVN